MRTRGRNAKLTWVSFLAVGGGGFFCSWEGWGGLSEPRAPVTEDGELTEAGHRAKHFAQNPEASSPFSPGAGDGGSERSRASS